MAETERTENSKKNLEMIVQGGQIILDSSSCMHENFGVFISNVTPLLSIYHRRIVIFDAELHELNKLAHHQNKEIVSKSMKAIETLNRLSSANMLAVMNLSVGQSVINKMQEFRGKINQTFITQDKAMAQQILKLNSSGAKIEVRQINQYGYLSLHRTMVSDMETFNMETSNIKPYFRVVSTANMYRGPFTGFKFSQEYKEGDTVYALINGSKGAITLEKKLAEGGEGTVYSVRNIQNIVVKLFKDSSVSDQRAFYSRKKVELLLESKLQNNSVCFPSSAVCDSAGNILGYAMKKAEGIELSRLLIGSQQTIKQYFGANTTRKETVRLCIAFLEAVKYLHDQNIVIGDLRTENIMVKSPSEITIIDTDSFQLNEFPCPVGMPLYTPPERITEQFTLIDKTTFMRKKSDDMFAVATILFQILMPPKEPYAKQDSSGSIIEDIKKGDFAYADPRKGKKDTVAQAPKGNWRFCWSHIAPQVRTMMYETFRKNEAHYAPEKRYTVNDWLKAFKNYYAEIESGKMIAHDAMSLDLIPIRFIKSNKLEYGKCSNPNCKLDIVSTVDLERYNGYCYKCAHTIIDEDICPVCQDTEIVYRLTDQLNGKPKPVKCWNCYQKELHQVFETRTCTVCGESFDITLREKNKYEKKGHELPKRCSKCREAGRTSATTNQRTTATRPVIYPKPTIVTPPTPKKQETFWEKLMKLMGM